MPNVKLKHLQLHPLHYLLVLISVVVLVALELKVPVFANGLRVAPFILITTVAALFGDFTSGILAVLLSAIAVNYAMPPSGLQWDANIIFKIAEFVVIGGIIFVIAWRSRALHASNAVLREATKTLQDITASLHVEARGNEKQLNKLNDVNKQLVTLVNDFIQDDEYWSRKITTPITLSEKHFSNPGLTRAKDSSG